jgi:hypothetical protein
LAYDPSFRCEDVDAIEPDITIPVDIDVVDPGEISVWCFEIGGIT